MTQTSLELDRFANVTDMVITTITIKADIAADEIHKLCEHQRRSIGQKTRWAIARAGK